MVSLEDFLKLIWEEKKTADDQKMQNFPADRINTQAIFRL